MNKVYTIASLSLRHFNNDIEKALPEFFGAVRRAMLLEDVMRDYLRLVALTEQREAEKPSVKRPRSEKRTKRDDWSYAAEESIFNMRLANRRLRDITYGELPGIRKQSIYDSILADKLMKHCIPASPLSHIYEFVDAETTERYVEEAKHETFLRTNEDEVVPQVAAIENGLHS